MHLGGFSPLTHSQRKQHTPNHRQGHAIFRRPFNACQHLLLAESRFIKNDATCDEGADHRADQWQGSYSGVPAPHILKYDRVDSEQHIKQCVHNAQIYGH